LTRAKGFIKRAAALLAAASVVGAVAAYAVVQASANGQDESTVERQLDAVFGPGRFQITLTHNGDPVTTLRPGDYSLTVHDNNAFHNFHLLGPNIDDTITTVTGNNATNGGGDVTMLVHLVHGTYQLQCDPHASIGMFVKFDVGGVGQVG